MKAPSRLYYDPDATDARPKFTAKGIRPSTAAKRVDRTMAYAFKVLAYPFDDSTHLPVRRYIARMMLTPAQLAMLVRMLGNSYAGGHQIPHDNDRCERYGCIYYEYRLVVFQAYRAALSLLVETAPRSRLDLDDLSEILMAWPGALPPSMQAPVAAAIGAHVADAITGKPFKRRPLVPRGGAR